MQLKYYTPDYTIEAEPRPQQIDITDQTDITEIIPPGKWPAVDDAFMKVLETIALTMVNNVNSMHQNGSTATKQAINAVLWGILTEHMGPLVKRARKLHAEALTNDEAEKCRSSVAVWLSRGDEQAWQSIATRNAPVVAVASSAAQVQAPDADRTGGDMSGSAAASSGVVRTAPVLQTSAAVPSSLLNADQGDAGVLQLPTSTLAVGKHTDVNDGSGSNIVNRKRYLDWVGDQDIRQQVKKKTRMKRAPPLGVMGEEVSDPAVSVSESTRRPSPGLLTAPLAGSSEPVFPTAPLIMRPASMETLTGRTKASGSPQQGSAVTVGSYRQTARIDAEGKAREVEPHSPHSHTSVSVANSSIAQPAVAVQIAAKSTPSNETLKTQSRAVRAAAEVFERASRATLASSRVLQSSDSDLEDSETSQDAPVPSQLQPKPALRKPIRISPSKPAS